MEKKEFKAASKRLLDLMINSIYTNKEIFMRELISNASDALDKLYYKSLESGNTGIQRSDFKINIEVNKDERSLIISDNGIGMSREELEKNLGTIAESGSLNFKNSYMNNVNSNNKNIDKSKENTDIIGQFGVGFYSAFMVADNVKVISKKYGDDEGFLWESEGADGYTIDACEKADHGTKIILKIKEDTEEENYSTFLEEYTIRSLIKKYSDYIRYPITMMVEKHKELSEDEKDEAEKSETYMEQEVLNTMEPIWKRQKNRVKDEDYNQYYKEKFGDYLDPAKVIRTSVEGISNYTALLFIPSHVPYDYYTKDFEKGLQLYSSGVLIMEKSKELLPDYFNFVRGLVDSQDLSLNISREMLQHDRQLKNIEKNLEKKIKKELLNWMKNDRESYEKFFENFGRQIKFGLYESFGMNKDILSDLVLFYSSSEEKNVSLEEYIGRMSDEQNYIYYIPGETVERIDMMPQTEIAKSKGYEILYLTDEIDEFAIKMMRNFKGKEFKSISEEDFEKEISDDDKKRFKELEEENKEFLEFALKTLANKVSAVKFSPRLENSAVCLTSKGEISLEMEKTINKMPTEEKVYAEKILELNYDNESIKKVIKMYNDDKNLAEAIVRLWFDQAAMISGMEIDDPLRMSDDINKLILKGCNI